LRKAPGKNPNRKFTPEQLDQQARIRVVVNHVKAMTDFLDRSITDGKKNHSAYNTVVKDALERAITGTYPDYALDWSKLKVSSGKLMPSTTSSAIANGTNIQFTWSTETPPKGNSRDKVLMVVYCPALEVCYWDVASSRAAGTATINADYFAGQVVHTYIGFVTERGDRSSVSKYTGQFTL
jgi:hypothetical protein